MIDPARALLMWRSSIAPRSGRARRRQSLHRWCDLQQGDAVCRARASPRPGIVGRGAVLPHRVGGKRSTGRLSASTRQRIGMAARRPKSTRRPERWVWCIATACFAYVTRCGGRAARVPSAPPLRRLGGPQAVAESAASVSTQVNVMSHVMPARKERAAKLVVIDPYRTGSAASADMHLALRLARTPHWPAP